MLRFIYRRVIYAGLERDNLVFSVTRANADIPRIFEFYSPSMYVYKDYLCCDTIDGHFGAKSGIKIRYLFSRMLYY